MAPQGYKGIVGIAQEGVFDYHCSAATCLQAFDNVLEKKGGRFAGLDVKVLLYLLAFLAAKGRVGQDDVVAVIFPYIAQVFGLRVGVDDIGRLDAVEDHVHYASDIGEVFLLLAIMRAFLEGFEVCRSSFHPLEWVVVGLA